MKLTGIDTPVYVKTDDKFVWPQDKMFYLLTRQGLFLGRNHLWFKSCVPVQKGPGELADQKEFCETDYPQIPRVLFEKAVGFFHHIYEEKNWESALLIVMNKLTNQVELICPEQKADWGTVKYDVPTLPHHLLLIGDIHAHGNGSPEPSMTDEDDEMHRPGLHIVAGGLLMEPPEIYCAVVADGKRFKITKPWEMIEDYIQRNKQFPEEWLTKITKIEYKTTYYNGGGVYYNGAKREPPPPTEDDKRITKNILNSIRDKESHCPEISTVRQALFTGTKQMTYLQCEQEAEKFVKHWKGWKNEEEKVA